MPRVEWALAHPPTDTDEKDSFCVRISMFDCTPMRRLLAEPSPPKVN